MSRNVRRRFFRLALCSLLVVGLLALPGPAQPPETLVAQSLQELQKKQQQLQQEQQQLQQEQQQLQQQQGNSENRLNQLQQSITATANQIAETDYRLQEAQKQLEQLQKQLEQAQTEYDAIQQAAVGRLQFLQRQQGSQGWAVLLQSQNFNEFLDRRYQLSRVFAADRDLMSELIAKAEAIEQQQSDVEAQKNQVAILRQQLLTQKQQYETEADVEKELIARLKQDSAALEAAEARLQQDSEQIGNLIRQRVAAQSGVVRGTGRFVYPVNARLTSGFGSRVHPILGYRRFHAGVDFGASHGTPIHAADAGRVIFAGWYGGYGQAVVIDHGGGLTTLYAHASRLVVREGQDVRQGQPVAAVGSTGLSTGPHLHFEVRQNGRPVNPMGFL